MPAKQPEASVRQEPGVAVIDTSSPDLRDYGIGAEILKELDLRRIRLFTNKLTKVVGLRGFGLHLDQDALTDRGGARQLQRTLPED